MVMTMLNDNTPNTYANADTVEKITNVLEGKQPDKDEDNVQADTETTSLDSHPQDDAQAAQKDEQQPSGEKVVQQDDELDDSPVMLKDLADTLDIDAKELYDVSIPIGDNKTLTLGELKDTAKKYDVLVTNQATFEDNKTRAENELMTTRRQLQQLISIGNQNGTITPALIEHIDQQHMQNMAREQTSLLVTIPEWKDEVQRNSDLNEMADVLTGYGFSRTELNHVADHRLMKVLYDLTKRINLVKSLQQQAAAPTNITKSGKLATSKAHKLKQKLSDAKAGTQQDKVSAISSLMN